MCLKKWDFEKENTNSFTLLRGREREISALVGVFEHYELYTLQLSHVKTNNQSLGAMLCLGCVWIALIFVETENTVAK